MSRTSGLPRVRSRHASPPRHAHPIRRSPSTRSRLPLLLAAVLAVSGGWLVATPSAEAAPNDNAVLILSTSVVGGAASEEAIYAMSLGFTVDVVDPGTWAGMSVADFGSYRAIILGDPSCGYGNPSAYIGAAEDNASTWGPAIDGNVIIIGTDPVFHGKTLMIHNAIDLVTAEPGKTGAYVSLSCYYAGSAPGTPVPVLDGLSTFGSFTASGVAGCFDNVHVVADHPALAGMDDAYLSNWGCSVHDGIDGWPSDFIVLALATTGGAFTAPDGTVGTPYIMARGESITVVSDVGIAGPATATVGSSVDYVATATSGGAPVVGATVTFVALAGSAHAGTLGTAVTNASGVATFSYPGTSVGTDLVTASFVDGAAATQTSGPHSTVWSAAATAAPTAVPTAAATAGPSAATTSAPSTGPTAGPTAGPTVAPTAKPTASQAVIAGRPVQARLTPPPTDTELARQAKANSPSIVGLAMLMLAGALILARNVEPRATRTRRR